jgi:hypothetical protein
MAILTTKTTLSSSDFFSKRLNINTQNSVSTTGDDRIYGTDKVGLGVRASATYTQLEAAAANINGDQVLLIDAFNNRHEITFSTSYSNLRAGKGSEGSITITAAVEGTNWNSKTLILIDANLTAARTLTMTFTNANTLVVKTSTSSTAIAYTVGLSGLTTITAVRDKIFQAVNTINQAGNIDITAAQSISNVAVINFTQSVVGVAGNTTIAGTFKDSTAVGNVTASFTKGGIAYTSSFAGLAGNADTVNAHVVSLYNSIALAYAEGKIRISPGSTPTAAVMTLTMAGHYVDDSSIAIQGSAIRQGEASSTVFSGAGIPQPLQAARIDSLDHKAYFYATNMSTTGTVNLYTKETSAIIKGEIKSSADDLTSTPNIDGDVGKTIILTSANNTVYTLTSVGVGADTAQTRTGDATADFVIATTMEETLENISRTLELLDNKAARETRPFVLEIDADEKVGKIKQTKPDGGVLGNTTITGTFIDVTQITGTSFSGGSDTYHLISKLGPGEHLYMPSAGTPVFYADCETAQCEVEYLILES